MKLNEQATLELTASTWLVIAQEGVSKAEALQLLGFRSNTVFIEDEGFVFDFTYDCPCCEHVALQDKEPMGRNYYSEIREWGNNYDYEIRECAQVCLLDDLWPKGCEHSTSPFKNWLNHYNTKEEKSGYSMEIAKFAGTLAGTWSPTIEGGITMKTEKQKAMLHAAIVVILCGGAVMWWVWAYGRAF